MTIKDAFVIVTSVFTTAFCLVVGYVVIQEYNHTLQLETEREQSIERVCADWSNMYPQTQEKNECMKRYI